MRGVQEILVHFRGSVDTSDIRGSTLSCWIKLKSRGSTSAVGIAKNMRWKGKYPVVTLVTTVYKTGVKLTKKPMAIYDNVIKRMEGLEYWSVEIIPGKT